MASTITAIPTTKTILSSQDSPMDYPLFLHHGESHNTILVTQTLIGNENCPT